MLIVYLLNFNIIWLLLGIGRRGAHSSETAGYGSEPSGSGFSNRNRTARVFRGSGSGSKTVGFGSESAVFRHFLRFFTVPAWFHSFPVIF